MTDRPAASTTGGADPVVSGQESDTTVAQLRADLAQLTELPLSARADRFEAINAALSRELADLDEV